MNLTAQPSLNATIYVENLYQGDSLSAVNDLIKEIPWVEWFQTWLESMADELPVANSYELSLRLTDDRQIQALNRQYRQQDNPTDVLSFAATEADLPQLLDLEEPLYLGDIVISLDTAIAQAQEQNHSLIVELGWLSSHGFLHLLGWDHPDEFSLSEMLEKQADLLRSAKIS